MTTLSNNRLLLVEPSATMRHVLQSYAQSLGFSVALSTSYSEAVGSLRDQFQSFNSDLAGVLMGWPTVQDASADSLIGLLDSEEFADLPVVVMSTDMRAETRAWVSGREHTAVLPWSEYQQVDALLQRLLDRTGGDGDAFVTKFDNSDIHVLIVDDSASIRLALSDLFKLHGYRVALASGREQALGLARQGTFDIAVLDFYMQDGTGDVLCRELLADPDTGNLTCTVLTGTYADHIIKRSLRAGAVECMFKNESSELLLARIDAIARFVRQRKLSMESENRLERLVTGLLGAVLVVDAKDLVLYANARAMTELAIPRGRELAGSEVSRFFNSRVLRAAGPGKHQGQWQDVNGTNRSVQFSIQPLPGEQADDEPPAELVINFETLDGLTRAEQPEPSADTRPASGAPDVARGAAAMAASYPSVDTTPQTAEGLATTLAWPETSEAFIDSFLTYRDELETLSDYISVLLIDTFVITDTEHEPPTATAGAVAANRIDGLIDQLSSGLYSIYRREHHTALLGNNRFGLLLRHTSEPQAYLLTRKIMQIINELQVDNAPGQIATSGCLASLQRHSALSHFRLLQRLQQGLDVVNTRGINQALLLDLRRMLPVYPGVTDSKSSSPATA